MVDVALGTEVEVLRANAADGAVAVRIKEGPKQGSVVWVPRHVLVVPDENVRVKAARARWVAEGEPEPHPRAEVQGAGPLVPREPGRAMVLCNRFNARHDIMVAAPNRAGWDLLQEWVHGRVSRQKLIGPLPGGTEVELLKNGAAYGAVEVRVTNRLKKRCVVWVDERDVCTPAEYEQGQARAVERARKGEQEITALVAKRRKLRKEKHIHDVIEYQKEVEEAKAAAKAKMEFEVRMAPARAQQQLVAIEQAKLGIAQQNADNYGRDVNYRAMYRKGPGSPVGPGGRPVLYGSQ